MTTQSDPIAFRNALGRFATGVTIVTTMDGDTPVGVTASSFNSVSLDPPLVLWSLARNAASLLAFETSKGFNVHVLAADQTDISNRFARAGTDKFKGMDWSRCENGRPVLANRAALFRCKTYREYEGGDHIIFVGEVIDYEASDRPVLVFHGGSYADAQAKPAPIAAPPVDLDAGRFTDDFLLYLLSRAHFQGSYPMRQRLRSLGLSESEYFCLSLLSMGGPLTRDEMVKRLDHTGHTPDIDIFPRLLRKGLVHGDNTMTLTDAGRAQIIDLLTQSKVLEERLSEHFSDTDLAQARAFLKRFIAITGQEIPDLW